MKITYKKPFIQICDLTDGDIVSTSPGGNIEDIGNQGEETPDEIKGNSPFRQGIWYILPYLMFLFCACSSADEIAEEDSPIQSQNEMIEMNFRAIMEGDESSSDSSTRAVFTDKDSKGNYRVHWQTDDKINVLYSNQDINDPFLIDESNLVYGIFSGKAETRDEYTALSPYQRDSKIIGPNVCNVVLPTLQNATPGSFDRYAGLLMGKANKESISGQNQIIDMYFNHVCCYIELKPTFDCQSIIISTRSSDEYLAGSLYLTYDKVPALDTNLDFQINGLVNKVTLQGPIKAGNTYYVAVLPGTLENGIRVTCVDNDGKMITKQKSTSVTLSRANYRGYTAFLSDPSTGKADEGVDLGTGVIWASQNLGATSPEELGDRYSWGETMPLYSYLLDTNYGAKYKSQEPTENEYDKNSKADPSTTLGSGWRMPTKEEIETLINNCEWTYYNNNNGVEGYIVSEKNISPETANQIFLPIRSGVASYWTSTLNNQETEAYRLEMNNVKTDNKISCHPTVRYKSFYIRPVKDKTNQ